MGFFSFIKGAVSSSRTISIDASLGNVLITGNSKKGAEMVMRNYAIDSVNKGYGVLVFRDRDVGMSSYPTITTSSRLIYDIDCSDNSMTQQVDIFAGLSDSEVNAYIIKLFDMYNEIDRGKKMSFQNYIALVRALAKRAGRTVRLNTFFDYPIEEVDDLNMKYSTGSDQMRNDRFLSSIRTEIRELEAFFYDFANNVSGYVLSGTQSLEQIFRTKPIIEVSLDFATKHDESNLIMSALIDAVSRFNLAASGKVGVNVIVDETPNEILISSGLQKIIRGSKSFQVLYTVQDLSNLVEQSNEWVENADSYFFFKQNSNKNKEFCSEFFGTYERQKETVTKGVSNPTFWDRLSGRGSSSRQSSTSITTEKERVYLPDVFASLPDNQAIYYCKRTNEHTRLNVF